MAKTSRIIGSLCILLLSLPAISQTWDFPSQEQVLDIYESQGIPFQQNSGRPALLVLSAGCGQCVELATSYEKEFIDLLTRRDINTRFIEMPGAVSRPSFPRDQISDRIKNAQETANTASMILECAKPKSGEQALSMIADIGHSARLVAGSEPDAEQALTSDWKNWVYLDGDSKTGAKDSAASPRTARVLQMFIGARNIDVEGCDQKTVWEQLGERHRSMLNSNIQLVPALYLLPNESYSDMQIWNYDDLYELLIDAR